MINSHTIISYSRPVFIWSQRVGKTLDAGCNDGSLVAHAHILMNIPFNHNNDWLHSFDIDDWDLPNFTRGNICNMPFEDGEFDTVVLGDVLEHIPDPMQALREADRVSKSVIIVTLPNEAQWHEKLVPFGNTELTEKQMIDATLNHPSQYAKCKGYVSEKDFKHLPHIHAFDFFSICELLNKGLTKQYMINIANLYHPMYPQNPEDPEYTPYWGIFIDKTVDMSKMKYGVTDIG